jgi:hypothetical protein
MIRAERLTASIDGEFVVFLIGMRVNNPLSVSAKPAPCILREVACTRLRVVCKECRVRPDSASRETPLKLQQARTFAMSLPSVSEEPHFDYSSFRVGGKIFATVPPEGLHLHVFVDEEQRQVALALEPKSVDKLVWGKKVVGLRVTLAGAKAPMVERLLEQAWSRKAPKRLLAAYSRAAGDLEA